MITPDLLANPIPLVKGRALEGIDPLSISLAGITIVTKIDAINVCCR